MVSGNSFDTCGCKDWTSFLTYNACFPYLHSPVLFIFLLPHLSSPSLSATSPLMPTFSYPSSLISIHHPSYPYPHAYYHTHFLIFLLILIPILTTYMHFYQSFHHLSPFKPTFPYSYMPSIPSKPIKLAPLYPSSRPPSHAHIPLSYPQTNGFRPISTHLTPTTVADTHVSYILCPPPLVIP